MLSLVLVRIGLMAPRWKSKVAAGTAMHHAELEDRWVWAMWSWQQVVAVRTR